MKVIKPGEQFDRFSKQGFLSQRTAPVSLVLWSQSPILQIIIFQKLALEINFMQKFHVCLKSYQNQYPCFETSVRTAKTCSIHFVHFSLALKPRVWNWVCTNVCFGPERTNCFCSALSNPLQIGVLVKHFECPQQRNMPFLKPRTQLVVPHIMG